MTLVLLLALALPGSAATKLKPAEFRSRAHAAVAAIEPTPEGLAALETAALDRPLSSDETRAGAIASGAALDLLLSPVDQTHRERHAIRSIEASLGPEASGEVLRLREGFAGRPELAARMAELRDRRLGGHAGLGLSAVARRLGHFFDLAVELPAEKQGEPVSEPARESRREALVTAPQGERFELEYEFEGAARRLAGTRQIERERKINLPSLPVETEKLYFGMPRRLLDAEDVVADLLDRFYWQENRNYYPGKIHLSPLAADQTRWHNGMTFEHKDAETSREEPMTARLQGDAIHYDPDNLYRSTYKIGAQFESADYFDDAAGALARLGVALRAKAWFRREQMGDPAAAPAARGVFLKRDLAGGGSFQEREELHVAVPPSMGAPERLTVARALLRYAGIDEPAGLAVSAVVDNLRYAVNLGWKFGQTLADVKQIGFATIDTFVRKTAGAAAGAVLQLELELFPEFAALHAAETARFDEFFAKLEARYGGRFVRTPKYLQRF